MNVYKNKKFFLYLISLILVFSVILTLIILKKVNYPWLVGYFLGISCSWSGFFYNQFLVKKLLSTIDPFLYLMLFILKLGIYIVPFLISFYLQNIVSPIGILIGLYGVFLLPFIKNKTNN
ncbi:hypothetical protein STURON_0044 [Spiroplasma turonicum]|uniref:ATP synthase protein I n=2 Tax=Spiroplasma turonicum TaxID=216946 RepID=A0A0K1P4Q7_9MOLU|nr:hypothetical protein STURON_0044 [Spiroplasma turonicum]